MSMDQIHRKILVSSAVVVAYNLLESLGLRGVDYHGTVQKHGDTVLLRAGGQVTVGNMALLGSDMQKVSPDDPDFERLVRMLGGEIALLVARSTKMDETGFIVDGEVHHDVMRFFWTGVKI